MTDSARSSPFAATITGTGRAFPEKRLTNADIVSQLGAKGIETSDEWIRERTGIGERRISTDGLDTETNSALCARAAFAALEMAGKKPTDIDMILSGTCTPDTMIPSVACWIQNRIGAKNAWGFDLNAACSGFLYAMAVADQFIKSGHARTVLVTGSDVLHPFVDYDDRSSCILFGDGAGALVVERTDANDPHRIYSSHLSSDGTLWDLFSMPGGGSKDRTGRQVMTMKGRDVFKEATRTMAELSEVTLTHNQLDPNDLNWFITHQANIRIIEAVAKRMDFPMERVLTNIDRYGNTSSGTVPTVLDENVRSGKIRKGDWILLSVFGAGLTSGSLLLRWGASLGGDKRT